MLCAALFLSAASAAAAQDTGRVAIGAGAIYSTQNTRTLGGSAPSTPIPPIGDSTYGLVVNGEVALVGNLAIGGELSHVARFDAVQTSGGASGTFLSDEHHRDLIVSALLHIHRSAGLRVLFDVVVGGSYVLEDTIVRTAEAPPGTNGPFGTFGREQSVKRNTAGGVGGLDMMIRVSRHLSIGPTVRLHIINRAKYPADNGFLELGENVLRAGVVTRVTF